MRIREVAVVVPARNEEELLPGCLASVERAARYIAASQPAVGVRTVVVLDGCSDASAQVAAAYEVEAVAVDHGCVGASRRDGVAAAMRSARVAPEGLWIASTDADTVVPSHWLVHQVELADVGADLVLGTVEPVGLDPAVERAWRRWHVLTQGHPHVHGANLGVRGSVYARVGGFAPLPVHEDVDLVRRARAAGARCVATDLTRVATSGRTSGRAPEGFAGYLGTLRAEFDSPA